MSGGETTGPPAPFDRLIWKEDGVLLGDLVFQFEPSLGAAQDTDEALYEDAFVLFKGKRLVDLYARNLSERRIYPRQILELGIWQGGSAALWFELFQPRKLVAVDIAEGCENEAFNSYVREQGPEGRLKTYWGLDQADSERLAEIVEREFDGPLDLVIDDASHLYGPTKASFETLFPRLQSRGLYCIEDWNWEHNEDDFSPGNHEQSLTRLIDELTRAVGSNRRGTVGSVAVFAALAIVERGWAQLSDLDRFRLDESVASRFDEPVTEAAPQ
jgi:hypothetical protein